jgi:LPPG:FO 2-phospho-L-lactate transferase
VIVVLAGGVGAARFLKGLLRAMPAKEITVIVNVADDTVFHGLHISPDIDTVVYTTADAIDQQRGWGLGDESWKVMESLGRYEPFGAVGWFNLGDRDLATHLWRTGRLHDGASLTQVTDELRQAWKLKFNLLPVSDDPIATMVMTPDGELPFQEYFVRLRHNIEVKSIRFAGVESATASPWALDAIAQAEGIIIAPSNPLVSIAPVLAVDGIRSAVAKRRDRTIAISPIVGGTALKGPADRMMTDLGHGSSVEGVAALYADIISTLIIDDIDEDRASLVEATGVRALVTPTVMSVPGVSRSLALAALQAIRSRP